MVYTPKTPKPALGKLIAFELFFKCLIRLSLGPVFRAALTLLMALTNYDYITWENIGRFATEPVVFIALVASIILFALLSLFEVAAAIHLLSPAQDIDPHSSYPYFKGGKTSFRQAMHHAWLATKDACHPKNFGFLLFSILILPLSNIAVTARIVERITIPEFVMTAIFDDFELTCAYLLILIAINTIVMKLIYVLPLMSANYSFNDAVRASLKLSRKHFFSDMFFIEGIQLGCYLIFFASIVGLQFITGLIQGLHIQGLLMRGAALALPLSLIVLLSVAFTLISPAVVWLSVLWRLNTHVAELGYTPPKMPVHPNKQQIIRSARPQNPLLQGAQISTKHRGIRPSIIGIYLLIWAAFAIAVAAMQTDLLKASKWMSPATVEISAHRGDVTQAPENTMAAFVAAKEAGADWIELDVQESKDGYIFVSHDSSFRRIAGVNKFAWEMNYSDIAKLSAGAYYSSDFENERFPLLQDVLIWAKQNKMKLNIELKPTGHEPDFEEAVAALIQASAMQDSSIVTSMNYDALVKMKQVFPSIKTAYVMTLAFGKLDELKAADIYSVEQTNCTKSFVSYAHSHGKEVLVWTVSDPAHIATCISNGADNIITDDVAVAKAVTEAPRAIVVAQSLLWRFLGIDFMIF